MVLVGDNKPEMKTRQLRIGYSVGYNVYAFPCMRVLTLKMITEMFTAASNRTIAAEKENACTYICKHMVLMCWHSGQGASIQSTNIGEQVHKQACAIHHNTRKDAVAPTHTRTCESTHNKGREMWKVSELPCSTSTLTVKLGRARDKWERDRERERENACCLHQRLLLSER